MAVANVETRIEISYGKGLQQVKKLATTLFWSSDFGKNLSILSNTYLLVLKNHDSEVKIVHVI